MGALLAGAKFPGDFEERLKAVLKEVTTSNELLVQLNRVRERLRQKKIHLHYTKRGVVLLGALGFDPNSVAWPVKKVIQQMVENEVAVGVFCGDYKEEDSVLLDVALHHKKLEIRKIESNTDADKQVVAND